MSIKHLRGPAILLALASTLTGTALAEQGEAYPQELRPFQSVRARADVRAEARNPVRISEGSTGVMAVRSDTTRDAVRQQASLATRDGTAWYGEGGRRR